MHTRAGKLLEARGFWYREIPKDEHRDGVCKTIMFKRKHGEPVAVMLPLAARVSYKKLRAYHGVDVAPLSPDELRGLGFEPGEVAPMLVGCELIVDPSCIALAEQHDGIVHTGSGTLAYGLQWRFADLEKMRQYVVTDVLA